MLTAAPSTVLASEPAPVDGPTTFAPDLLLVTDACPLGGALGGLDLHAISDTGPVHYVLYPEAGEATVWVGGRRKGSRPGNSAARPDRRAKDAASRAAGNIRRYAMYNELRASITLTFKEEVRDRAQAWKEWNACLRAVRRKAGAAVPWVAVMEGSPGHRCHLHVLVREGEAKAVKAAWRHGRVVVKVAADPEALRRMVGYISKTFEEQYGCPGHRYRVAKGFRPEKVTGDADARDEAREAVIALMGGECPDQERKLGIDNDSAEFGALRLYWDPRWKPPERSPKSPSSHKRCLACPGEAAVSAVTTVPRGLSGGARPRGSSATRGRKEQRSASRRMREFRDGSVRELPDG